MRSSADGSLSVAMTSTAATTATANTTTSTTTSVVTAALVLEQKQTGAARTRSRSREEFDLQYQSPSDDGIFKEAEQAAFRARHMMKPSDSKTTSKRAGSMEDLYDELTDNFDVHTSLSPPTRRHNYRAGQLGSLRLSLMINPTSRELLVTVIEARNLPRLTNDGTDSYVKVSLCSDQSKSGRRRTRTAKKTCSPVWDETLAPLKIARESVSDDMLKIQVCADSNSALIGETYLPLDRALRTFPDNLTDWFTLQPGQIRRRSGTRWLKRGEGADVDFGAPLLSFLNDRLATLEESAFEVDVNACFKYRGSFWEDFVPEMASLEGKEKKLANAIWELFTTETAHLSVLSVLSNPFYRMLEEVKQNKTDARVKHAMKNCKLDKIFGNIHELMEISFAFVKELESALVSRAEQLREVLHPADTSSAANARRVTQAVLDVGAVVDAFADLQERLLEPEMKYRLNHDKARKYLKKLLHEEADGPFGLFVQWCEEDPRCDRHSLVDLLTQPLQRLTRYPLLLKAIHKHTDDDNCDRERMEQQIVELTFAIDEHDREVRMQDNCNQLRKLQNILVWPAPMEISANAFVSPVHTAYLNTRKPVDVRVQVHRIEQQYGTAEVLRKFVCDGWLTPISRAGKELQPLYVSAVGHLLIFAKVLQSQATPNGLKRSTSEDKSTFFADGQRGNSSDEDNDEDEKYTVDSVYHLSEVLLLDVEDQTPVVKNCFTLVFMGAFNTPHHILTLKADSAYDKAEWTKHIRNGIDSVDKHRKHSFRKSSIPLPSRESASTINSEIPSRRESAWALGESKLRGAHSSGERPGSRDTYYRRRTSDTYDELPGIGNTGSDPSDGPSSIQDLRRESAERHKSHSSPLSSNSSSIRSHTASTRSTRSQRISERANRLSQTAGVITSRDVEESGELTVPGLRRKTGLSRQNRGRLQDVADRFSSGFTSTGELSGLESGGSTHSLVQDPVPVPDSHSSPSPMMTLSVPTGSRQTMSIRSADAALQLSERRSSTDVRRPNSADAARALQSGRPLRRLDSNEQLEDIAGDVSDTVHTPLPSEILLQSKANSFFNTVKANAEGEEDVINGSQDVSLTGTEAQIHHQEDYNMDDLQTVVTSMPSKSPINRLVSRYRKRLSTNLQEKGSNVQLQASVSHSIPEVVEESSLSVEVGSSDIAKGSPASRAEGLQQAAPHDGGDANDEDDRGGFILKNGRKSESGRTSTSVSPAEVLRPHSGVSAPHPKPGVAARPKASKDITAAPDASRPRVPSLGKRHTAKTRDTMLLALQGHDNSGTLV
eukprot:m.198001 g.198001  ORF g.198001 m.198001 type:complete len:1287 (-) comp16829_c1_seq1:68-3928(-)